MKVFDATLALLFGAGVALGLVEFLAGQRMPYVILLCVILPALCVLGIYIGEIIGKKYLIVYQLARHVLVGAFATIVDLKVFELLGFFFGLLVSPIIFKAISFIFSTGIKYVGNKHWAFEKQDTLHIGHEATKFFVITLIGLLLDVGVFYFCTNMLGAQFGLALGLWAKVSVIISAIVAAVWNFIGYKFLVFKK